MSCRQGRRHLVDPLAVRWVHLNFLNLCWIDCFFLNKTNIKESWPNLKSKKIFKLLKQSLFDILIQLKISLEYRNFSGNFRFFWQNLREFCKIFLKWLENYIFDSWIWVAKDFTNISCCFAKDQINLESLKNIILQFIRKNSLEFCDKIRFKAVNLN